MQAQPSRKPSTVQPIKTPRQPSSMYCHDPACAYCQELRDAEQELLKYKAPEGKAGRIAGHSK
jgi:hypothetical protein